MGITILVSDSSDLSTLIGVGALPRGSGIVVTRADQIQGWVSQREVFPVVKRYNKSSSGPDVALSRKDIKPLAPFALTTGDCQFAKGGQLNLFCGPARSDGANLMMYLSNFPSMIQARISGFGRLLRGGGQLRPGSVWWEIVATENSPQADNVLFY